MSKVPLARIEALTDQIRALLAGQGPSIQGTVLADLVATFIAGFIAPGDPKTTAETRENMLQMHIDAVRDLIPVNEIIEKDTRRDPRSH